MAFWVSLSVSVPDGGSVDKSDSDGNYKQGMNEVTLAVAAKVSFCSGILRFLTPGLTEEDILISFEKEESELTSPVQPGLEDWRERMDHQHEARRICTDLRLRFINL